MEDLNLDLGPYAPAIVKQLADRGLMPKEPHMSDLWEGQAKAIGGLGNCRLLTAVEASNAYLRLLSRIAANVEKLP